MLYPALVAPRTFLILLVVLALTACDTQVNVTVEDDETDATTEETESSSNEDSSSDDDSSSEDDSSSNDDSTTPNEAPELNAQTKTGLAFSDNVDSASIDYSDADSDPADISITVVNAPEHGSVTIDDPATGAFTYTPTAAGAWNGDDFSVYIDDGEDTSSTEVITLAFSDGSAPDLSPSPNDGADQVGLTAGLALTSDDPLNLDTIDYNTSDGACTGSVQLSTDGFANCLAIASDDDSDLQRDLAFVPANDLDANTTYEWRITADLENVFGLAAAGQTLSFTTADGQLLINEVGSSYYINTMRWFEVYNPGSTALDLADYELRSRYTDENSVFDDHTFALPSVTINAGQYLIIRAQSWDTNYSDTDRVVHLKESGFYPYWDSNGYLELLDAANGSTVDFVTFGQNYAPTDSNAWSGGAATLVSTTTSFGESIGRDVDGTDTNAAGDWTHSDWATIGGPNDVLCNTDDDGDMIPDCNEEPGTTFAGMPLYDWGARKNQPDIFIEVDYMDATDGGVQTADEGIIPRQEALQSVVDSFAAEGIAVHFDVGDLFDQSAGTNPAMMDLGGGGEVPFADGITIGTGAGVADLYNYKSDYFDHDRLPLFHYMLFANSQNSDGSNGSSGLAELVGNDILITMGNWGLNSSTTMDENMLINYQAGTVMHELGHNLGLRHGGGDNTNNKPNYLSVMNYLYQLYGLPVIGTDEGDRYYRSTQAQDPTCYNGLTAGPEQDPSVFNLDYSHGTAMDLDLADLSEPQGLRETGSGNVDFNCNGNDAETGVSVGAGTWTDHDDWGSLVIDFGGYSNLSNQGFSLRTFQERRSERFLRLPDPVGNDRAAQVIKEPAPPQNALPSHYFLRQQREQAQP